MKTLLTKRLKFVATCMASLLVMSLVGVQSAGASNDLGHRIAGPYNIIIGYHNLTPQFSAAMDWNINNNVNPTNPNVSATRLNEAQVLNAFDEPYAGITWAGLYECVAASWPWCIQANVHFNLNYGYSTSTAQELACHEVGHSVGLGHNNSGGCLNETVGVGGGPLLGDHNVSHINTWY